MDKIVKLLRDIKENLKKIEKYDISWMGIPNIEKILISPNCFMDSM